MGAKIVICHHNDGSNWTAIEISTNALNGHSNHELDIWPPVADVSPGMNWPAGEAVYLNGCALSASPSPTSSPSASSTAPPSPTTSLPETGGSENIAMSILGVALLLSGAWMKLQATKKARSLR